VCECISVFVSVCDKTTHQKYIIKRKKKLNTREIQKEKKINQKKAKRNIVQQVKRVLLARFGRVANSSNSNSSSSRRSNNNNHNSNNNESPVESHLVAVATSELMLLLVLSLRLW